MLSRLPLALRTPLFAREDAARSLARGAVGATLLGLRVRAATSRLGAAASAWSSCAHAVWVNWASAMAAWPLLLMVGKKNHHGKNKRKLKPANHGARPCNHVGRQRRRPRGLRYRG